MTMHNRNEPRFNDVNGVPRITGHVASGSGGSKASEVVIKRNPCTLNIGTWNVRTMQRLGKIENVLEEMKLHELSILGLSETRWKGNGDYMENGYRVIYAGGSKKQNGVAVILDKHQADKVIKISQVNDRLIMVKLSSTPVDIIVIQVYMPTSQHKDEEIEQMYEEIEEVMRQEKGSDFAAIMGDWNAVVGEGQCGKEIGPFGLGKQNHRGQMLKEFCERHKLMVSNTWFKMDKRKRYTWKQPGDKARFQLDYILVRQRHRNSIKRACTFPGADADTDHCLVAMKTKIRFRKARVKKSQKKWNLKNLTKMEKEFNSQIEIGLKQSRASTMDEKWIRLRDSVIDGAKKTIGYEEIRKAKKPWVTDDMIKKIAERRKWKSVNSLEGRRQYRKLNNEIRRATETARKQWWRTACEDIEDLARKGQHDIMYAKVRQILGEKRSSDTNIAIKDKDGCILIEEDKIRERWATYIEELYEKDKRPNTTEIPLEDEQQVNNDEKGPDIIRSEIHEAIRYMKKKKSPGADGIPAELIKALSGIAAKELENISMKMYEDGEWPEEFCESVILPMKKKPNALECKEYRTLSLVCHSSKIMLRILARRLERIAEGYISPNQFGFRKEKGTREAIGILKSICERSLEFGNNVYTCFVDLEKAFDRVDWKLLLDTLTEIGVDWRDRRMIRNLYLKQTATVRIQGSTSRKLTIGQGVRQGCPLSPLLFSIYQERMMREAMDGIHEGITVGGNTIAEIRFADDQAIIADSEEGLQRIMNTLDKTAEKYNMKINLNKTKVMKISKQGTGNLDIQIRGKRLEQVQRFRYLGSIIQADGGNGEEIKARLAMGRLAFQKRKELLSKGLETKIKNRIIKSFVWSIAVYACETWTLKENDRKRIEAFEMWIWRRSQSISWRDRITNEEVLNRVGEDRQLLKNIKRRKKTWIGHVLRGNGLVKEILEGRMQGKRTVGRKRQQLLDDIAVDGYQKLKQMAQDRKQWRLWMP